MAFGCERNRKVTGDYNAVLLVDVCVKRSCCGNHVLRVGCC